MPELSQPDARASCGLRHSHHPHWSHKQCGSRLARSHDGPHRCNSRCWRLETLVKRKQYECGCRKPSCPHTLCTGDRRAMRLDDVAVNVNVSAIMVVSFRTPTSAVPCLESVPCIIVRSESKAGRSDRTLASFCVVASNAPCLECVPHVIVQTESRTHRPGGPMRLRANGLTATGVLTLRGRRATALRTCDA